MPVAVAWLIHELGGEHLGRTRVNQEVTNDEATLERDSLFFHSNECCAQTDVHQ